MVSLLIAERKAKGLSQRDLASRLAKPPNFVARIETGQRNVSVVEFVVIARALDLQPEALFGRLLRNLPEILIA